MGLLDALIDFALGKDHVKKGAEYFEDYRFEKTYDELQSIINNPDSDIYQKEAAKAVIELKQYRKQ